LKSTMLNTITYCSLSPDSTVHFGRNYAGLAELRASEGVPESGGGKWHHTA
jgi:hypothetical protein